MNAYLYHFSYEFKAGLRDRSMLLMYYLFPIMFYCMLGAIMPGINPFFKENMVPAMVVFAAMASAFLGLPAPLVSAREGGVLRSYRINGVPAIAILGIPVCAHFIHITIVSAVILISSQLLFGAARPVNMVSFVAIQFLVIITMASIGTLFGVIASNSKILMFMSQAIFLPSTIIGGMMFPLDLLPATLRNFSLLLPPTHAIIAFQGVVMGKETIFPPHLSIIILLASCAISSLMARLLFFWDTREQKPFTKCRALLALVPYGLAVVYAALYL